MEDDSRSTEKIVVITMLGIFSVTGVIGNAIAFYIYNKRRDKTTSVIFILALAGTDFFTCLVIIPFVIAFEALDERLGYDIFCNFFYFLITFNIPFSAYVMAIIALDRYFCICHPFLHVFNVQRAKVIVLCLALVAFTFGILTALNFKILEPEDERFSNFTNGSLNVSPGFADVTANVSYAMDVNSTSGNATGDDMAGSYGACMPYEFLFTREQLQIYQKVYAGSFLLSCLVVIVLYIMIYRSLLVRRAKKAKRKRTSHYVSVAGAEHTVAHETQMTALNGNDAGHGAAAPTNSQGKRNSCTRSTTLYDNIKTAVMLFVVAIVFILAFLPAWMMGLNVIPMQIVVYDMYFVYNVANPFIYAFMNVTFRNDLKRLFKLGRR